MLRKPTTLVFCEWDPEAARKYAASLRTGNNAVLIRAALQHTPYNEVEEHTHAVIMPDVTPKARAEVKRLYPEAEEIKPRPKTILSDQEKAEAFVLETPTPKRRKPKNGG